MIHYNNDNNAYCSSINAQNFEAREHNTVYISRFLSTRNLYSYSHLEKFIFIYSVRGEIDQISTNTFRYTTCCAANVYMFVYILIRFPIVPLRYLWISIIDPSLTLPLCNACVPSIQYIPYYLV